MHDQQTVNSHQDNRQIYLLLIQCPQIVTFATGHDMPLGRQTVDMSAVKRFMH